MADEVVSKGAAVMAFVQRPLVRRVLSFLVGVLVIAGCGLLPVSAQALCKTVVAGVQGIVATPEPSMAAAPSGPSGLLNFPCAQPSCDDGPTGLHCYCNDAGTK